MVAAALLALGAASAQAQLGDVGEHNESLDTPMTPVAKKPPVGLFTQVAGARWDEDGPSPDDVPADSITPFEVDFHAVAARDAELAFAGGSIDEGGKRRPVLYRYTLTNGWSEEARFGGSGYVAKISWIDERRALAVGGDGTFPDREREDGSSVCGPPGVRPADDQAGDARVWLYTDGEGWRELSQLPDRSNGDEIPDAMGGLTALDFYEPAPPQGDQPTPEAFGIAGGLCQLWHWRGDGFERSGEGWAGPNAQVVPPPPPPHPAPQAKPVLDEVSPPPPPDRLPRFRVRDVTFAEGSYVDPVERRPRAYAVTTGCCIDAETDQPGALYGLPETLTYTVPAGKPAHEGTWVKKVRSGNTSISFATQEREPPLRATMPDSHVAVVASQTGLQTDAAKQPIVAGPTTVTSPAGAPDETLGEPPSQVAGRSVGMSSVRLVDADGDVGGATPTLGGAWENEVMNGIGGAVHTAVPDGVPDWSVGELSQSGRAVAYGTNPAQLPPPEPAAKPLAPGPECKSPGGLQVVPIPPDRCINEGALPPASEWATGPLQGNPPTGEERAQSALQSARLLALPSFGLAAIEMLDAERSGWAVGAHGAIVRLSLAEEAATGKRPDVEDEPPRPAPGLLPDRSAWSVLPAAAASGLVPALVAQPRLELDRRELVPSVGPVPTLMSSDRRSGLSLRGRWRKLGSTYQSWEVVWEVVGLMQDGVWHHCLDRLEGDPALHPACESYQDLKREGVELSGWSWPAAIPHADGKFEVVGISTDPQMPLMRFADGSWKRVGAEVLGELAGTRLHRDLGKADLVQRVNAIVFTAPDDGFLIGKTDASTNLMFAFDGRRWRNCTDGTSACDPHGLMPQQVDTFGTCTSRFASTPDLSCAPMRRELLVDGDTMIAYGGTNANPSESRPYVAVRKRGNPAWSSSEPGAWHLDPDDPATGSIEKLSLQRGDNGALRGVAFGKFQLGGQRIPDHRPGRSTHVGGATYAAARLGEDGVWRGEQTRGALSEDLRPPDRNFGRMTPVSVAVTEGARPETFASMTGPTGDRVYRFDEKRERWDVEAAGAGTTLTPDPDGGLFVEDGEYVRHLTDRPLRPVFAEVPRPAPPPAPQVKLLAAARDGTVWAATDSDMLYRYDRMVGWDRVRVPGWEPGEIVTAPAPAAAISVGPDGHGLVVGKGGRIARIAPEQVEIDGASRWPCAPEGPVPPCGTDEDLRAVAVADDGAAVTAGERRSLLWRPPDGELRAITPPRVSPSTTFTAVAIADESTIWAAARGRVYAGTRSGDTWRWKVENVDGQGNLLPIGRLALDRDGRGFAIGIAEVEPFNSDEIFERVPGATRPWRAIRNPTGEGLHSLALAPDGGPGALIGGDRELILTWTGEQFAVARPPTLSVGLARYAITSPGPQAAHVHPVTGVALAPGTDDGEVEAWAATGPPENLFDGAATVTAGAAEVSTDLSDAKAPTGRLLHFASDEADPLLNPAGRAEPLPDAPPPAKGELAFAAFGKSDCQVAGDELCVGLNGGEEYAELIVRGAIDELARRDDLSFAVWTGDAVDEGSYPGHGVAERTAAAASDAAGHAAGHRGLGIRKLRRWGEQVPDRLADRGLAMLGTPGFQDLSAVVECAVPYVPPSWDQCRTHRDKVRPGDNFAWRAAMTERSAPWGRTGSLEARGLTFERVRTGGLAVAPEDQHVAANEDAGTAGGSVGVGGAATHYAVDAFAGDGSRALARLVFVDTSQGSLSGSDPLQHPVEVDGGQATWLDRVLCQAPARTPSGEPCTRGAGQRAIVVTNTPTYSYGPAAGDTLTDSSAFESILMRHDVDVAVAGRLGWNARYWATVPGVHEPCPGESYRDAPPSIEPRACGQGPDQAVAAAAPPSAEEVAGTLGGPAAPVAPVVEQATSTAGAVQPLLPFVVASGAGGKFAGGDDAMAADARDGFWHGYSVVRLDPSRNPRKVIVEQRPVYDHIGIDAQTRMLRPGQRLTLRGFGRSPVGFRERGGEAGGTPIARFDRIATAAITHRYDLVLADPAQPSLPVEDAQGDYVSLPSQVATVDRVTGVVRAGRGRAERTHAIAILSVGDKAATYPLAFEPRRSFAPQRAKVSLPPLPRPARAPAAQPPVRVADAPPPPPAQPPAQPGSPLASQTLQPPQPPQVPSLPATGAPPAPAPPALQSPPAPPAPPPPPATPPQQQPMPLNLNAKLQPISLVPSVNPPAPPPVNPAPPAGGAARKEAKQKQAAVAKSEEGESSGQGAGMEMGQGNSEISPDGVSASRREVDRPAPATRRAQDRPTPSFSAIRRPDQMSAWTRGALYGGGLGLAAFAFSAAWLTLRPRPRRREPRLPAPAWARRGRLR